MVYHVVKTILVVAMIIIAAKLYDIQSNMEKKETKTLFELIAIIVLCILIASVTDPFSNKLGEYILSSIDRFAVIVQRIADEDESSFSMPDQDNNIFDIGSGTKEDPYIITSAKQLSSIRFRLTSCFEIDADIDLSAINWEPIGTEDNPFKGFLNGNGHYIRNLSVQINSNDTANAGLFGVVGGGTIRDLNVANGTVNVSVDSNERLFSQAGGIAGCVMNGSLIERASYSGTVSARGEGMAFARCAGIAAIVEANSRIANCFADANISSIANASNTMAGGIVAWLNASSIVNSYGKGTVTAVNATSVAYTGGIAASGEEGHITNCVTLLDEISANGEELIVDAVSPFAEKSGNLVRERFAGRYYQRKDTGISDDAIHDQSTYEGLGWDFANIWVMENGLPIFRR